MTDLKNYEVNNHETYNSAHINEINHLFDKIKSKSIVYCEKSMKTRKKLTNGARNSKPSIIFHLSNFGSTRNRMHITRFVSMPEIINAHINKKKLKRRTKSSNAIPWNKNIIPCSTKYIISEHRFNHGLNRFNIINQTHFKVYRCQVAPGVAEDCHKCCCSCNSDVLFEVMKDLYDCYKQRDCDNCNCILCSNLPEQDRSEMLKKKSVSIGLDSALKELAMKGFPLPEGKTESEKMLIEKVRNNLGLPPEPKTDAMRNKYTNAANAGLMLPLEKKKPAEKEKILKGLANMGIPLPEGRTASEKSLIAKIKAGTGTPLTTLSPSEKMRKAKSAGLLTPFEGKPPDKIEKILKGLAMQGIPLPEGKTPSKKKLINKVRADLGLPPEPTTPSMVDKHNKAAKIGLLVPLEGKTPSKKEKILHGLHNMGIPLPVGRTPSEKALIAKVKAESKVPPITSSEKLRAKSVGTTLDGKTPAQKEALLRDMAMKGVPLPEGKTESDKNLINKIRHELGLPPEPKTPSMKDKHEKAADTGLLLPLEGKPPKEKERILRGLADMKIPLPKGRTPSEKALITKVKLEAREPLITPEKMRKAKAAGLLTPFEGKTPEQKEKIFRGLAMHGIPLPEGKTKSDKILLNKIRAELGLPPEPNTPSIKEKYTRAADAGLLLPLEGKTPKEKEKILRGYVDNGIPLPEGRTPSEKALIAKVRPKGRSAMECLCDVISPLITPEKINKAKAAGLLTPLEGKPTKEKEKILRNLAKSGLPLPLGKTPSEAELIKKIKKDYGIREETPEEKIRKAQAAGFLTPIEGKTPEEQETILRGRVAAGLPLPEGNTPSQRDLIKKIKESTGYVTPTPSERLRKAEAAGLLTPLKGKTPSKREKILKDMLAAGVPITEGTTPSEKEIIKKIIAPKQTTSRLKAAKAAGLLTPLAGKTPEHKEKILRGLAKMGLPLPKPNTPSEINLVDKVRFEMGLPPEPKSRFLRNKYEKAHEAGIIQPLEGKSPKEKEKILKKLKKAGIPLPVGRTRSEKALINSFKAGILALPKTPFDEMTPEEKEKRLKHLVKIGRPLPDGKTPSGKALVDKVRKDMGLPPAPTSESMKIKMKKAQDSGLITPLQGKNELQKKKILSRLAKAGIPLPEGRTPSEKSLIRKIRSKYKKRSPSRPSPSLPSDMRKKAQELGLLTPLAGKSPEEKEKLLREMALQGLPFPEATSPSEKLLTDKIRKELGLPPAPSTSSMEEKHKKAAAAGLLKPLEVLTEPEKIKNLQELADMGIPLPEGRTQSEKDIIEKINAGTSPVMKKIEEEAADLLIPLTGKLPEVKEKILRGLAEAGLPLPKGKTKSEKSLIRKIKAEYGIPPTAKTASQKDAIRKAKAKGLFTPLAGKDPAEKERIIRGLADAGLPLPEGKTATEKDIIKKVKADLDSKSVASEDLMKSSKSTCERACGCENKKIKFKHSYVKISIVSPDISNLCPCPNECIPGVKGGIYAGNKGIDVVVERLTGVPLYPVPNNNSILEYKNIISSKTLLNKSTSALKNIYDNNNMKNTNKCRKLKSNPNSNYPSCIMDIPFMHTAAYEQYGLKCCQCEHENLKNYSYYDMIPNIIDTHRSQYNDIYDISSNYTFTTSSSQTSFDSILFIKSDSSLSLNSLCEIIHTDSILVCTDDSSSSTMTTILNPTSNFDLSDDSIKNLEFHTNGDDYRTKNRITRTNQCLMNVSTAQNKLIHSTGKRDDDYQAFQMSQTSLIDLPGTDSEEKEITKSAQPVVVLNQLNSDIDVTAVVDEILSNKEFSNASSLYVIVPTSDDEDDQTKCANTVDTPTCFHLSKNCNKWNCSEEKELVLPRRKISNATSGLKVSAKGKKFFLEGVAAPGVVNSVSASEIINSEPNPIPSKNDCDKNIGNNDNKICQSCSLETLDNQSHVISTDTTQDRPCCCNSEGNESLKTTESNNDRCIMNVVSEVVIPLLNTQGITGGNLLPSIQKKPKKEAKHVTLNSSTTSVSVCNIPPCVKMPRTCHFADNVQYSDNEQTDPFEEFKHLLEQQSPETIRGLIDQLKYGGKRDTRAGPEPCPITPCPKGYKPTFMPPDYLPPESMPGYFPAPAYVTPTKRIITSQNESCPKCGKPKQYQEEYKDGKLIRIPMNCQCGFDEICPTCFKPKYVMGKKVKCACSGKTKTIKLRSLCPCEQHQWPMSKILYGPKPGTRSIGDQCCLCDDRPIIGPNGIIIPRLGQTAPMIGGPLMHRGIQYGSGSIITPKDAFKFRNRTAPGVPQPIPMGYYGQPNLDSELGQIEVVGPAGGYVIEAPGGTFTQAGTMLTRISTGAGTDEGNVGTESTISQKKNCDCADKKGKKKGKHTCECPPEPKSKSKRKTKAETGPEPVTIPPTVPMPLPVQVTEPGTEPKPVPKKETLPENWLEDIEPEPQNLHYLEYYDEYLRNKIESHRRKILQMRSDLTQTTSGFKFNKKKRPRSEYDTASDDSDVSVEDAIRYYALTNPELLRELIPADMLAGSNGRTKEDCVCEEVKAVNTDIENELRAQMDRIELEEIEREERQLAELERVVKIIKDDRARRLEDCDCPEEPLTEEQKAAIEAAEVLAEALAAAKEARQARLAARAADALPEATGKTDGTSEDEGPKGLKIRMPGKGSGSKGLAGICCFDMIEERGNIEQWSKT